LVITVIPVIQVEGCKGEGGIGALGDKYLILRSNLRSYNPFYVKRAS